MGPLAGWWATILAYLDAPLQAMEGHAVYLGLTATIGIACLMLGLAVAVVQRESRALWTMPLVLSAALTLPVVGLAQSVLGWLGGGFVIVVGAIMLPLFTHLVARDASHRMPVWLIGVFAYTLFVVLAWEPLMTILGITGA